MCSSMNVIGHQKKDEHSSIMTHEIILWLMLFYVWQWQLINIIYYNNNWMEKLFKIKLHFLHSCLFDVTHWKVMRCNQHKNLHHLNFFPAHSFIQFKRFFSCVSSHGSGSGLVWFGMKLWNVIWDFYNAK